MCRVCACAVHTYSEWVWCVCMCVRVVWREVRAWFEVHRASVLTVTLTRAVTVCVRVCCVRARVRTRG